MKKRGWLALWTTLLLACGPVVPASAAVLSGTVRDGYGVALEGCFISLYTSSGGGSSSASDTTNGSGSFRLDAWTGVGSLHLSGERPNTGNARVPNYWSISLPFTLAGDAARDLALPEVVEVAVVVTESDGSPIVGSNVTLADSSSLDVFPASGAGGMAYSWANTSVLGVAHLVGFRGARIAYLNVEVPATQTSPPRTLRLNDIRVLNDTSMTIVIPPSAPPVVLSGTLTDGYGFPVDGCTVNIWSFGGVGTSSASDTTDALGRYSCGTRAGEGSLQVSGERVNNGPTRTPDLWSIGMPLSLVGDLAQDLTLPEVVDISMQVMESDGTPMSGAALALTDSSSMDLFQGSGARGMAFSRRTTDSLGCAVLTGFRAANVTVTVEKAATPTSPLRTLRLDWFRVMNDTTMILVLPPSATPVVLTGMVRDGYGTPVADSRMDLSTSGSGGTSSATDTTDGSGTFRLATWTGAGWLTISGERSAAIQARTPHLWWIGTELPVTGDGTMEFSLPEVVDLRVRLTDPDGRPIPGAALSLADSSQMELFPGSVWVVMASSWDTTDSLGSALLTGFRAAKIAYLNVEVPATPTSPFRTLRLGEFRVLNDTTMTLVMPSNLDAQQTPPTASQLALVFRNPSATEMSIAFSVPISAPVRLRIFDIQGRTVAVLRDGFHASGTHSCTWNLLGKAGPVPAGAYIVSLEQGNARFSRLLLVTQ